MSSLLVGLVSALVATNQAAAVSNLVTQTTGIRINVPDPNDPVERQFKKLEDDDDAAEAEVDGWIRENNQFAAKGGGVPAKELNARILKRFEPVRKGYEDFIREHPGHARARIAYASFLHDIGEEDAEVAQLEKARSIEPKNPAIWNNLANYYGHEGEVTNAFVYYARAIELNPAEPVYYHNLGTTVYLFRKDAREFYHINEQQVFDKALGLYSNAIRLDPTNFPLASDVAQTYYGIRPLRTNDAFQAWTNALNIARDEVEREGVYIHFARLETSIGHYDVARAQLDAVTNAEYADLKARLVRNLADREKDARGTNAPAGNDLKTEAKPESSGTNPPAK